MGHGMFDILIIPCCSSHRSSGLSKGVEGNIWDQPNRAEAGLVRVRGLGGDLDGMGTEADEEDGALELVVVSDDRVPAGVG